MRRLTASAPPVRVAKGEREVNGKSVLGLMLLEVTDGCEIVIKTDGEMRTRPPTPWRNW